MRIALLTGLFFALVMSSCIVTAPRYTRVEQVLRLHQGMTEDEVKATLCVAPYDLKSLKDSGTKILIYKYRVTDRRTVPLFKKATNGISTPGKYVDLFVTYTPEGKVSKIESCSGCESTEEKTKKIDWQTLITLLTVTLPALAVYFGLK